MFRGVNIMKIGMISLGCSKNQVDSEMLLGRMDHYLHVFSNRPEECDLLVINTCGFIQSAKQEAIQAIFEMVQEKKEGAKLVVMGCLATRYADEIKEDIPEVDRFIKIAEYGHIDIILNELFPGEFEEKSGLSFMERKYISKPHMAYIRIADGCDNHCHYCAIPLIRGDFKSRQIESIVEEAKQMVLTGKKEITLISQDTNRYGLDLASHTRLLPTLLEKIATIDGIEMVRFLYLYPDEISEELIEVVKKYETIASYFDVPIQHANNEVLKSMNRRNNKEGYLKIFQHIKEKIPNAILRTTVIVGYPGETKMQFQELVNFIEQVRFDRLGAFRYSQEEDTVSYGLSNQIDEETKNKRYAELMKVQRKIAYLKNKEKVGELVKTVIEGYDQKLKMYKSRSYAFAPDDVDGIFYIKSEENLIVGNYYLAKVIEANLYDLIGEIVK